MKDIVVVDIDGTLSDLNHRLHFVRDGKKDWDKFFQEAQNDSINEWCRTLCNSLMASGLTVLLVSGRPKRIEALTRDWLRQNGVLYTELFCVRDDGDHAPDDLLKRQWLKPWRNKILFIVDDRQRVVDMWREEGLTCLQCNVWEEK